MSADLKFTVAMAVYRDYAGAWATATNALVHHAARVAEVLISDNDPGGPDSDALQSYCRTNPKLTYLAAGGVTGTSFPRDAAVRAARSEFVVVVDPHVDLHPGALDALAGFYADPARRADLAHGPMVYDWLTSAATHLTDEWGGDGLWGRWAEDPRWRESEPFEIPAMGMGLFACRRDDWPGFHRLAKGFGGEEGYVHEKYRRLGRRCWCVPGLKWSHRFGRPAGPPYPLSNHDKCRNYVFGLTQVGVPLDRVRRHYVERHEWVTAAAFGGYAREAEDHLAAHPFPPAPAGQPATPSLTEPRREGPMICRIRDKNSPSGYRYAACAPDDQGRMPCYSYLPEKAAALTADQAAAVKARLDPVLKRTGNEVEVLDAVPAGG